MGGPGQPASRLALARAGKEEARPFAQSSQASSQAKQPINYLPSRPIINHHLRSEGRRGGLTQRSS